MKLGACALSILLGLRLVSPLAAYAQALSVSDTADGQATPIERQGRWRYFDGRWWFMLEAGEWLRDGVALIEGKPYAFDAQGWMIVGWGCVGGRWYYATSSGELCQGWQFIDGCWYYFHPGSGLVAPYAMQTEWLAEGDDRYYLGEDGRLTQGWRWISDGWHFFDGSGRMARGWRLIDGHWYFFGTDASTGSGRMLTGLIEWGGHTFCLNTNGSALPVGAMAEGWVFDRSDSHYLYFYPGWGAMARDTWVEGSYVDVNGYWVPDA